MLFEAEQPPYSSSHTFGGAPYRPCTIAVGPGLVVASQIRTIGDGEAGLHALRTVQETTELNSQSAFQRDEPPIGKPGKTTNGFLWNITLMNSIVPCGSL